MTISILAKHCNDYMAIERTFCFPDFLNNRKRIDRMYFSLYQTEIIELAEQLPPRVTNIVKNLLKQTRTVGELIALRVTIKHIFTLDNPTISILMEHYRYELQCIKN